MSDKQVFIFSITFAITYWILFRILTSRKFGYVWITQSAYIEADQYINRLIKQNQEYKKLLANKEHFPTTAKPQTLFDNRKIPSVNGQRYPISFRDGTYSLPYVDYVNYQKGLIKVERTTYTRKHTGANWSHNPTTQTLWITEDKYSPKETYSQDKLICYKDKMIDLDWRKESDIIPHSHAQLELIK